VAAGGLLGTVLGEQTAVATLTVAAVAAVAGNGAGITAHEGDRHEGEEHRNCKSEKTLHNFPPVRETNAFAREYRTKAQSGTVLATGGTPLEVLTVGERLPLGKSG
jgi:hypothetical protein